MPDPRPALQPSPPWRSLKVRLAVMIIAVMSVAAAGFTWTSHGIAEAGWEDTIEACGLRISAVIQGATHQGMLQNKKDYVHHTIQQIAQAPEVEHVHIYDKRGRIIFSDDSAEIGDQVDTTAQACVVCHANDQPLTRPAESTRTRVFHAADGHRLLGVITAIPNSSECATGACHFHPKDEAVLGVLDVQLSLEPSDEAMAHLQRTQVLGSTAIATALILILGFLLNREITQPVSALIRSARRVANGDLDTPIRVESTTEMGQLATAFQRMAYELARAREENQRWANTLEQKVAEQTEELRHTQRQMVHMEKMASLGKLAATVAHELNNPLAGILNYAKLIQRYLEDATPEPPQGPEEASDGPEDDASASPDQAPNHAPQPTVLDPEDATELLRFVSVIESESSRSGEIVRNLLLFSRYSRTTFQPHPLHELVSRSAMLIQHHLDIAGVRLALHDAQGCDDVITCDGNQIQQALVALLINAVEAMPDGGTIDLSCAPEEDAVTIHIADTGSGIPESILHSIFEPFFSTKDKTEGVGLGLAVVYGIVQRHQGTITVDSRPEQGTTFHVRLPRNPDTSQDQGKPT